MAAKKADFAQQFVFGFDESLLSYFNIFFGTTVSAFYEEILYRFYAPAITFLASESIEEKHRIGAKEKLKMFLEGIIILFFALGHKNGGWPSVMNALFAGTMLRILAMKTQKVTNLVVVHAVFNMCQYAMFFRLN